MTVTDGDDGEDGGDASGSSERRPFPPLLWSRIQRSLKPYGLWISNLALLIGPSMSRCLDSRRNVLLLAYASGRPCSSARP
ncbi:hypothetical protein I7I53_00405 [Histoplasma capsulatum var. duboisii H88]|nr:hypothetical protein I7I53_00405 [Histoplasma capsulatum var. duboisii H88]